MAAEGNLLLKEEKKAQKEIIKKSFLLRPVFLSQPLG